MTSPLQLSLPESLQAAPETVELAVVTDEVAGVNTSGEESDWNPILVILAVVLIIAGIAAGVFGFRSTTRKKETLEERDPVRDTDDHRR